MTGVKTQQSLKNLNRALTRLTEVLEQPMDDVLTVDGTIQRFEFVSEFFWKTLKRLLADEGAETATPRKTLQRAYQAGWLQDETAWLQMLRDRNETSYAYDEDAALRIYHHIREYDPEMERTLGFLNKRFGAKDEQPTDS